jgi:GT2 family glycosyltransferase
MQGKLAVVILNFNGKVHLEKFLPSVLEFSIPHQIIVADNCSTDDSVSFVRSNFPIVEIIQNKENGGFAKGYNDALKTLEGRFDFYLLLNSDVEVTENWIKPLLNTLENRKIAACQPKILSYNEKTKFEHAGATGGYIDEDYFPFCRGRIFDETETDSGQYDFQTEITWTSGAAMLIRSDLFHAVGGFDERFFAHMEEIDLCLRLAKKGYTFYCNPTSCVYHLGGGTLPYNSANKVYLNFRNNLFLLVKNHPGWLVPKLFRRMALDGIAAIKFLMEGKISHFWKIFLSHIQLYINLPRLLKQRSELKFDKYDFLKYHGSILWAYFIQKNKHFSDLNSRKFEL